MLAKDLISDEIPALRTSDTAVEALNWMEVFRISHLPIVNNKEFLGLISESDIFDVNKPEEPIWNHQLSLLKPFVKYDQHIYEVIEAVSRLKLTVVPVLDYENNYLVLKVPSAINSGDFNYLINPNHAEFSKVKVIRTFPFYIDTRLTK